MVIGNATRNCNVPLGKALFFPIIDAECSTAEGNGTTREELLVCAKFFMDEATNLSVEIDGVPVRNPGDYRVQSPLFTYGPLPANNALNLPQGTISPAVSDGYFLMLTPLSAGKHTIHFHGSAVFTQAEHGFDFSFTLDITYNLTVR
ncbi:MAG: hypothetical protein HY868_03275 [Chloroflexi bacterium]|nr:hypothetical protein [Chloroflexota bacterium]